MTGSEYLDTGVRALDALSADEAARFDEHVADCEECAAEYDGFRETAALLASAAAEPPPADLRDAVLAAASRTPQLPPGAPELPPAAPADRSGGLLQSADTDPHGRHRDSPPWWRRPVGLLAAAAVIAVLVVVVGGTIVATRSGKVSPEQVAARCVAVAADAQTARPSVGSGGSVTIARSCDAAVVHVAPMPPLPAGKGYQLWVMAGDKARSVGMVTHTTAPAGEVIVTGLRDSDTDIGVSVEPAAGSVEPTTKPVWVVPIAS